MNELQYEFKTSRYQTTGLDKMYMKMRQDKGSKGLQRAARIRYVKFHEK